MKYFAITFFVIIFLAVGFLQVIKDGWYPALIINSKIIWAKTIEKEARAATYYYEKAGINLGYGQIKKAATENIIEKTIISKRLQEEMSQIDLTASLNSMLATHLERPEIEPAAALLYGLELQDFYDLVLVPQAEKELLEKRLQEKREGFMEWLQKAKDSANIVYITKEF